MSGSTTRDWAVVIDWAAELRPNEIAIRGTREGQPVQSVYRAGKDRMRVLESSVAGKKEIAVGRFVGRGETPWQIKCSG